MDASIKKAYDLLKAWKGDSYIFGLDVLDQVGVAAAKYGKNVEDFYEQLFRLTR